MARKLRKAVALTVVLMLCLVNTAPVSLAVEVSDKVEITNTDARRPEDRETVYAKGLDVTDWFLCRFDSHGNICNSAGIVVFPSGSGRYPAKRGDTGYFGDFRENYTNDPNDTKYKHLPSVHDNVYNNHTED